MNIVSQLYPDAKSSDEIRSFIWNTIEERMGLDEHQILFIESSSGNDASPIKTLTTEKSKAPFVNIGGLAGFPFQGISGLAIAPEVISENGGVLIFYVCDVDLKQDVNAPVAGETLPRRGSAISTALKKLVNNQILLEHISEMDYQMNFIEQLLFREQRKIKTAVVPLLEAAEVVYEAIDRRIQLLFAKTNYMCRYAFLVGAIRFWDQSTGESYYVLKRFMCLDPVTKNKVDWKRIKENC